MSAKTVTLLLLLFAAGTLGGQTSATSYVVTRLGVDTVAIERYTRSKDKLEGDQVLRYPRVRTIHYVADLGTRGEIKTFTTVTRRANAEPGAPPVMETVTRFGDTLAVIEVRRNGQPDTAVSGRK